jgi:hypothetical protein
MYRTIHLCVRSFVKAADPAAHTQSSLSHLNLDLQPPPPPPSPPLPTHPSSYTGAHSILAAEAKAEAVVSQSPLPAASMYFDRGPPGRLTWFDLPACLTACLAGTAAQVDEELLLAPKFSLVHRRRWCKLLLATFTAATAAAAAARLDRW